MTIKTPLKIAVILPTLNEKNNLEILIPQILDIEEVSFIVIVDDASTDGSEDYFQRNVSAKIHVVRRPARLGIGSAHLDGLEYSKNIGCEVAITMDADGTHRIQDLVRMIDYGSYFDVLIGSRYIVGGEINGWSLFRNALTRLGHVATYLFFGSPLDMSSGMRAYRIEQLPFPILRINCPSDYSFFFVSLLVISKINLNIKQIPISLSPRLNGDSKMSLTLMCRGVTTLFLFGLRLKKLKF